MSVNINNTFIEKEKNISNNFIKTYSNSIFHDFTYYTPTETKIISIAVNQSNGFMIGITDTANINNLIYSNDGGNNWTSYFKNPLNNGWKSITYGNGKFVVIGSGPTNYLMYSISSTPTSSSDWIFVTIPTSSWIKIIFASNVFIGIANSGTFQIIISNDGINWTSSILPPEISNNNLSDIVYGNGRFIITTSGTGLNSVIYSIDNGKTWNTSTNGVVSSSLTTRITYSNKLGFFLRLGLGSSLSYTIDGDQWYTSIKNIYDNFNQIQQLIWIDELEIFVIFGTNTSDKFIISTSFDGYNWSIKHVDNNYENFTSLIWNKYYEFLIGTAISSVSPVGTPNFFISKSLGISHLLSDDYYIKNRLLTNFTYNITDFIVPKNSYFYLYPVININNDFLEYSISPNLPAGITLNISNGLISGSLNDTYYAEHEVQIKDLTNNNTIKTKINLTITHLPAPIKIFYYNFSKPIEIVISSTGLSYTPTIDGTQPVTYSLKSGFSLPFGLSLDSNTGTISGSVLSTNLSGTRNVRIIATNSANSFEILINFILTDYPVQSFNYNGGNNFVGNASLSVNFTPTPNLGTNITYSISSSFNTDYPNLFFNTNTGIITGTLPSSYKNGSYIITAENTINIQTTTFGIRTNDIPINNFSYNNDNNWIENPSTSLDIYPIPNPNGATNISYSISPVITNSYLSLNFNTSNGRIWGTLNGSYTDVIYSITASNNTSSLTKTFRIITRDISVSSFSYPTLSPTYTANVSTALTNVFPTPNPNTGTNVVYSSSPNLSSLHQNLTLDPSTGRINGTLSSTPRDNTFTITAINNNGSSEQKTTSFRIIVNDVAISSFTYSQYTASINTTGVSISPNPSPNPGTNIIYSISPPLSTSYQTLNFNSNTGIITGSLPSTARDVTYTIRADNGTSTNINASLRILTVAPPSGLSYNSGVTASPIILDSPTYSPSFTYGVNVNSYSITPTLSNGLTFNTSTGIISGTLNTTPNNTQYTITASNIAGTTSTTFRIRSSYASGTITKGSQVPWGGSEILIGYASWKRNALNPTFSFGSISSSSFRLSNGSTQTISGLYVYNSGTGVYYVSLLVTGNHQGSNIFTTLEYGGYTFNRVSESYGGGGAYWTESTPLSTSWDWTVSASVYNDINSLTNIPFFIY